MVLTTGCGSTYNVLVSIYKPTRSTYSDIISAIDATTVK